MKKTILSSLITAFLFLGCGNNHSEDNIADYNEKNQNILETKWQGDDSWYINKYGNFNGEYEGWYRYSISLPSENFTEIITFPNGYQKNIFTNLVFESYKKNKNSTKISRELFFEKGGNKNDIRSLSVSFDNKPYQEYHVATKYGIQIHFDKKDIEAILQELKNAKTFVILYEGKKAKFRNIGFKQSFIE